MIEGGKPLIKPISQIEKPCRIRIAFQTLPHCSKETAVFHQAIEEDDEKPLLPFINGRTRKKQDRATRRFELKNDVVKPCPRFNYQLYRSSHAALPATGRQFSPAAVNRPRALQASGWRRRCKGDETLRAARSDQRRKRRSLLVRFLHGRIEIKNRWRCG
ncbi:hypothetical protein EP10_001797 [Geobacillus icigianus]|uniref:Uncharacterized protein n=1 Tax=Geobacillus icigianus TaxID=1430331 RepID=A0ABU6BGC6_9BACL|nr:hypothetical protein [Geobacillus icigianus]